MSFPSIWYSKHHTASIATIPHSSSSGRSSGHGNEKNYNKPTNQQTNRAGWCLYVLARWTLNAGWTPNVKRDRVYWGGQLHQTINVQSHLSVPPFLVPCLLSCLGGNYTATAISRVTCDISMIQLRLSVIKLDTRYVQYTSCSRSVLLVPKDSIRCARDFFFF